MLKNLQKKVAKQPQRMQLQNWLLRRFNQPQSEVFLQSNNIFVIPNKYGLLLGAMLFVLLLGAMNYSNSMTFMLTFLIVGIALIALYQNFSNLSQLKVSARTNPAIFAGDSAKILLDFYSSNQQQRLGIFLGEVKHKPSQVAPFAQTSTAHYFIDNLPRGLHQCPKVRIFSHYPLGLFFSWSWLNLDSKVLVYPRPISFLPLPYLAQNARGSITATQTGDDDFFGIRKYLPTDSSKRIAWKAMAKHNQLMSKEFSRQLERETCLDFGQLGSLDTEAKLSQLCYWILECERKKRAYMLKLPNFNSAMGLGSNHRHQCLQQLALFGSETKKHER